MSKCTQQKIEPDMSIVAKRLEGSRCHLVWRYLWDECRLLAGNSEIRRSSPPSLLYC